MDIVGFDTLTNEIQVIKVMYTAEDDTNNIAESLTMPYYKTVVKDVNIV